MRLRNPRQSLIRLGVLSVLFLLLSAPTGTAAASDQVFRLTILHQNDFHGADPIILAREATLIKKVRAEAGNLLVLDAGDLWTRGAYAATFHGELEMAALNLMGFDAMTLGNNEFETPGEGAGLPYLGQRIRQAAFPLLSANIHKADGDPLPGVRPYIIKEVDGVKIALVGLTSVKVRGYPQAANLLAEDPHQTVSRLSADLSTRADLIIALSHLGLPGDYALARAWPGLAAIIGGDTHLALPEAMLVRGIPIVQAGSSGRYLGRLDLEFKRNDGRWVLHWQSGQLIRLDRRMPEDPEMRQLIDDYLTRLKKPAA